MTTPAPSSPLLEGIRVLDFTQYLAGPTATRFLAELGADVIKVEQAPMGDPARALPVLREGRSIYFIQQNRGKKSLCLDFAKPEAVDLLRRLAGTVDVVIENYGPGVLERRGLGWDALSRAHPRLVLASISAFGKTGPLSHKVGFDLIAQAFSGLMHMTGDPAGPPAWVGLGIADVNAGVHAFGAICAALLWRERSGRGQQIDVAMVDAVYHMHEGNVQWYANGDRTSEPMRYGAQHSLAGPMGVYRAPEGWIVILTLERQWPSLAKALGRPELVDDPRFATGLERGRNRAALAELIEGWMARFPSDEAVLAALEENRVPAAPVLSIRQTVEHPQFAAREMVRRVPDPILGEVTIPGFPLKFSAFPAALPLEAPLLGEHNAAVLHERLGLAQAEIDALAERGVLHAERR